jgi:predicted DNA-binding transcriptional regulator AlpA
MTFHRSLVYMPKKTPAFKDMLADIGNPHPREIAKAMKVTERSVWRWLKENKAPHSVMLAIYWLTRWGVSEIDTAAHNAAIYSAAEARGLRDELESIKARLAYPSQTGIFGSSNDSTPGVEPDSWLQLEAKIPDQLSVDSDHSLAVEPNIHAGYRRINS